MWHSGKTSLRGTRRLKSQNASRIIISYSSETKNTKLYSCTPFLIILMCQMAGLSRLAHTVGYLYEILDSMNCQMRVAINSNNHLENQNLSSQVTSVTRPLTPCTSTQTRSREQTRRPTSRPCVPTNRGCPPPPVTATPPLSLAWSKICRRRRRSCRPTAGSHIRPQSSTRWPHSSREIMSHCSTRCTRSRTSRTSYSEICIRRCRRARASNRHRRRPGWRSNS